MAQAKNGDTVKVNYTGKLEDDFVFDTSENREPLQFIIGENQVIPGFEEAVVGMAPGESKVTKIPADNAYGTHREELVQEVDKNLFPDDVELTLGLRLQVRQDDDEVIIVRVIGLSDTKVTLDANHPLAGKDLTFEIQLMEIV